jgi:hypothetical protein
MQRSAYGLIVLLTLAAIPLSARAAPAQADRQANCIASVDAAVSHVSWNGLKLNLWHVPGYGLYAYKITAPANLASGWRFCEPTDVDTKTVEQCIGAWRPPIQ